MSALHDFDFLQGSWQVHNRRLRTLLCPRDDWQGFETRVESRPLLGGRGNMDTYEALNRPITCKPTASLRFEQLAVEQLDQRVASTLLQRVATELDDRAAVVRATH